MAFDNSELRKRLIEQARGKIKEAYSSEEYVLMQAINAYLELNKSLNLANERLSEWSGIYLPEVEITSPTVLANLAAAVADKDYSSERIGKIIEDPKKAEEVSRKIGASAGRSITDDESKVLRSFADQAMRMQQTMAELSEYIKLAAKRLMPNVTYLTDEMIAAELLARAGSMERLAMLPASTIQLLGAEKALFKHIKYGSKPPKYGVLFKLPEVTAAPRYLKGKIARAYATKITIALKADHFSKRFIAEQLKKDLNETIKKMKEMPPKPERPERFERNQGRQFSRPFRPQRQFGQQEYKPKPFNRQDRQFHNNNREGSQQQYRESRPFNKDNRGTSQQHGQERPFHNDNRGGWKKRPFNKGYGGQERPFDRNYKRDRKKGRRGQHQSQ